jgi:hypothetical protein
VSPGLVLVAATIASFPGNGGIAWERLSWALGLRRLGWEVVLVDQLDPGHCVHEGDDAQGYEGCLNLGWFERIVERFGLAGSAALIASSGESLAGVTVDELIALAGRADLLVNVAGDLRYVPVKGRVRRRIYVDVDPGFTQLWLASGRPAPRVAGHDLYFTIGENVGTDASSLPTAGIHWRHTRQPVVLDLWPVADDAVPRRFTTVGRWTGTGPHGRLEEIGPAYAQKSDELMKVLDLPRRSGQSFEIALDARAGPEMRRLLATHGWHVLDAATVAGDPDSFRRYVQGSWAEFSVAKGAYVDTSSGWFSERTIRYLASGRPALVQDTGFSRTLPVGEGLLAFRTLEEAVEGARALDADYDSHRRAARRLAESHFDSDVVLERFLADVKVAR